MRDFGQGGLLDCCPVTLAHQLQCSWELWEEKGARECGGCKESGWEGGGKPRLQTLAKAAS